MCHSSRDSKRSRGDRVPCERITTRRTFGGPFGVPRVRLLMRCQSKFVRNSRPALPAGSWNKSCLLLISHGSLSVCTARLRNFHRSIRCRSFLTASVFKGNSNLYVISSSRDINRDVSFYVMKRDLSFDCDNKRYVIYVICCWAQRRNLCRNHTRIFSPSFCSLKKDLYQESAKLTSLGAANVH